MSRVMEKSVTPMCFHPFFLLSSSLLCLHQASLLSSFVSLHILSSSAHVFTPTSSSSALARPPLAFFWAECNVLFEGGLDGLHSSHSQKVPGSGPSRFPGFSPQCKNMRVRLTGDSKLPIWTSVYACLSTGGPAWTGDLSRVHHCLSSEINARLCDPAWE